MSIYTKDFYARIGAGSRQSAQVALPLVFDLLKPNSVLDVGCGSGTWLAVSSELGVQRIQGVDGAWVAADSLQISKDFFRAADLTKPLQIEGPFDLAISMEVAEHLPESRSQSFVNDLTALSKAVLFSAAVPRQGGDMHINEQWQDYWAQRFEACGYVAIDCVRPAVWNDDRVDYWYAQNVLLYVSKELLASNAALRSAFEKTNPRQLNLIHPKLFTMRLRKSKFKLWVDPYSRKLRSVRDRLRGK